MRHRRFRIAALLFLGLAAFSDREASAGLPRYEYSLADFSGLVPLDYPVLFVDRVHDEVLVADGDTVRVFNASGMEIFDFSHEADALGPILGLAVDPDGDNWILSYRPASEDFKGNRALITRADYRGVVKAHFGLRDLPEEFGEFAPNVMLYREGKFVLASLSQFLVATVDREGRFLAGRDLWNLVGDPDKHREDFELGGISIDSSGKLLFTVPELFHAYILPPEGPPVSFGQAGSAPGKFGVVAGIVTDDAGNLYIADVLKDAVSVFTKDRIFVGEFGHRGIRPDSLIRPAGLAIGNGGQLFVTQIARRGISVFRVVP